MRKNSGVRTTDSIDEEEEEDVKTKNLAKYLGMKDGVSGSIASQVKVHIGNKTINVYLTFIKPYLLILFDITLPEIAVNK